VEPVCIGRRLRSGDFLREKVMTDRQLDIAAYVSLAFACVVVIVVTAAIADQLIYIV
jgi:hypothetical protein